jgi:hypothetical protein
MTGDRRKVMKVKSVLVELTEEELMVLASCLGRYFSVNPKTEDNVCLHKLAVRLHQILGCDTGALESEE